MGPVLLVDDAPAVLSAMTHALSVCGVGKDLIVAVDNAADALGFIESNEPELIFMDVALGQDAGDALAVRLLEQRPERRIVMMTGLDTQSERVRAAISAGVYDVLQKPIRIQRIRQVLELIATESQGLRRV